ncbi:hypothetical protein PTL48_15005, partial [Clostridium perfringens]|nr:hypothetical protein [Clostridium perfringens]
MATTTVIITSQSVAAQPGFCLAIVGDAVKAVSKKKTDITQQWKKHETDGFFTFENASNSLYMCPDKSNPNNPNGVTCGEDKFPWTFQNNTIRSSTEPSKAIKMVAKEEPVKFVTYDAANSSFFMWDIA